MLHGTHQKNCVNNLGTTRETAGNIAHTGFTTVSSYDSGYFGRGIYFTSSIDNAKFYSLNQAKSQKLCLILSVVIPGNVYPVTEHHKGPNSLQGGPIPQQTLLTMSSLCFKMHKLSLFF